jgi:hypothetical protein
MEPLVMKSTGQAPVAYQSAVKKIDRLFADISIPPNFSTTKK